MKTTCFALRIYIHPSKHSRASDCEFPSSPQKIKSISKSASSSLNDRQNCFKISYKTHCISNFHYHQQKLHLFSLTSLPHFEIMASTLQASFFFVFLISSLALEVVVGRDIPTDTKMQPEVFFDGTVWVPGLGRYMLPKKGSKSLDYNPITGAPGGNGVSIPGISGSTGSRNYIPGGDDTTLPNPGVEVPNPIGGAIPTPNP